MTFQSLKKNDLVTAATHFGTEVKPGDNEKVIITNLLSDGVTWEMYMKDFPAEVVMVVAKEEDAAKKFTSREAKTLIKMERHNASFETSGYTFTQKHPFAVVTRSEADFILVHETGFRLATPAEAEAYYG